MDLFVFYVISFLIIIGSLGVISANNPFYSVLFLIFTFFNGAALYIVLQADFLGMVLIIVYVGAVAVLFLFTVMLVNIKSPNALKRKRITKQFFLSLILVLILSVELFIFMYKGLLNFNHNTAIDTLVDVGSITNLGVELFNNYYYVFIISGLILVVAMIGAIVVSDRDKKDINKRQHISQQNYRSKLNTVKNINVTSEKGID